MSASSLSHHQFAALICTFTAPAIRKLALPAILLAATAPASAFCGFYVGKADASLFNEASKVVMVRDGDRTTINMLNDFQGDLKEFALVVPVPEVLKKEQVRTPHKVLFDRLDAYSAPRLAEYFDPDPCVPRLADRRMQMAPAAAPAGKSMAPEDSAKRLGVTIEAQYTVGAYDIVILGAKESDGLETWLTQSGYRIPPGASKALAPYIRQGMKFFVAKVNLEEQAKTGSNFLSPLAFSFKGEKFMLPIRLGMVNAKGPQDLVVWMLTPKGRVETTNYRTVKLPANMDIPAYIKTDTKQDFAAFYKTMFQTQAAREQYRVVFTEYFWDMSWCDPCAANPLSAQELRNLGVEWVKGDGGGNAARPFRGDGNARPVLVTRLHLRYTPETFPEDLMFQETGDRQNYQTRYVLRHAVKVAPDACPQAPAYLAQVAQRKEKEAQMLASLTGWDITQVRQSYGITARQADSWQRLFNIAP